MKVIDEKDFESETKSGLVLVDFYASWCGPCSMMGQILEENEESLSDIKIVKVNVDEAENLSKQYGVMMIPTLLLMKNGSVCEKHVGIWQIEDLLDTIDKYK